jgi:hypothetical protein
MGMEAMAIPEGEKEEEVLILTAKSKYLRPSFAALAAF